MRTLFVGDVHGCAAELAELIDVAAPERIILLGDLFTKGPDPVGVWQIVKQTNALSVMGNHDMAVLQRHKQHGHSNLPDEAIAWLAQRPLTLEGPGWLAVHAGLHPTQHHHDLPTNIATLVRRWPDDKVGSNPFWWELYDGPGLVIYGHDARRMLIDRRPHTLGLDTGCVYGKRLTGYLLEADELLSVPARAVHCPVRRPPVSVGAD